MEDITLTEIRGSKPHGRLLYKNNEIIVELESGEKKRLKCEKCDNTIFSGKGSIWTCENCKSNFTLVFEKINSD